MNLELIRGYNFFSVSLIERWKHKEVSLDEVFKGCVLFLEAAMIEPATQVSLFAFKEMSNLTKFLLLISLSGQWCRCDL